MGAGKMKLCYDQAVSFYGFRKPPRCLGDIRGVYQKCTRSVPEVYQKCTASLLEVYQECTRSGLSFVGIDWGVTRDWVGKWKGFLGVMVGFIN